MASTIINISNYSDALIVLGTAGVVVPMVRRFGLSPVLGYLGAGALLGPLGLGTFNQKYPALFWFTISDARNVDGIAELGIVFLLFLIGLELSLHRLLAMRRLVFGLGGLQVLLTTALLAGVALLLGQSASEAVILGACLSLSSTAIVLEFLSNQERLTTTVGRASFSVLLAQDLAVIPILMFISILAAGSERFGAQKSRHCVAPGRDCRCRHRRLRPRAAAAAVPVGGERAFHRAVHRRHSVRHHRGRGHCLRGRPVHGAGRLHRRPAARRDRIPQGDRSHRRAVQGLLLGIFFFTVGMDIDVRELLRDPLLLAGGVVSLIVIKSVLLICLARIFHLSWPVAVETGLLLGPGGEFAFVGIGMAAAAALIEPRLASFTLAVTSVTMALTPLLILRRPALRLAAAVEPARGHRA